MNVLFLDIDGVLNSLRTAEGLGNYPHQLTPADMKLIDAAALGLIRRVLDETGSAVVFSTTWRLIHDWNDLATWLDVPAIGATPRLNGSRGLEIHTWLEGHPEVSRYAIVDDDSDMLPDQLPYFVKTSHDDGLRMCHYRQLRDILRGIERDPEDELEAL